MHRPTITSTRTPHTDVHEHDEPEVADTSLGVNDRGQATTEYALILLVAAILALLAIGWATAGGGAGKIGSLFDTLFSGIINRATEQL